MSKQAFVYILANKTGRVLYTGVTSDLKKRVWQHKHAGLPGFTLKYHVHKLVYYEVFDRVEDAIFREKQIKAGSRKKKIRLIESTNPSFKDLYYEL